MSDQPGPERSTPPTKGDIAADKARRKAERPWYKKKRFMIPLVLLGLIVLGGLLGGEEAADVATDAASDTDDSGDAAEDGGEGEVVAEEDVPEEVPEDAEHARIGEPASDGQFTFTVESIDCGATELESEFGSPEVATGQWCTVTVVVENTGDEARSLSASDQYLYDDQDRQFSAAAPFGVDTPIYEQLNPGLSMTGQLHFDVPTDFTPALAELHDSAFSTGVLVDLSA